MGRPSLRPGRYFRRLFIGYFEGLSSERGIASRVADSPSLRSFLNLDVTEAAPDHSTVVAHAAGDRRGDARVGFHVGVGTARRRGAGGLRTPATFAKLSRGHQEGHHNH